MLRAIFLRWPYLSRRTVQTHVSHILTKLDIQSRWDIARLVPERSESEPGDVATA